MSKQEIVMLCDRSGSMKGKEKLTIDGINTTINELKNTLINKNELDIKKDRVNNSEIEINNENIYFTLKFFNNCEDIKINSLNINKVDEFTVDDIKPYGSTSLLDVIGNNINYFIEKKRKNEDAYNSCLIYVITDGLDNTSKIYDYKKLKQIINIAEISYNIKILYLGANQDAIFEASKFGVAKNRSISFIENSNSIPNAYGAIASSARRSFNGEEINFTEIERSQSQIQ